MSTLKARDLVGRHINLTIYFWNGSVRVDGVVKLIEETDCVAVGHCFLKANAEIAEASPDFYAHHATTAQRQAEREEVAT